MKIETYSQYSGEPAVISQEDMECLAEKIVSGTLLTVKDRKLIYTVLTGDPNPEPLFQTRKGPKCKTNNYMKLASEFIEMRSAGIKTKDIMPVLGAKYNLLGQEKVSRDTFNKAVSNGKNGLVLAEIKKEKRLQRLAYFNRLKLESV